MPLTPRRFLRLVTDEDVALYPKASLFLRLLARVADVAIAWALTRATGPAGFVCAFLYLLFADSLLSGQSLGKKTFGIKVVYLPLRSGAKAKDSALRNGPIAFVVILAMMPDIGLEAFVVGSCVAGISEGVRVLRHPFGLRLGDVWAQTQVIDGKVGLGDATRLGTGREAPAPGRLMVAS